MPSKTGRHEKQLSLVYKCAICHNAFNPYRPQQQTCSAKCRNAKTAIDTARVRAEKIKARGKGKSYLKDNGRHVHRTKAEEMLGRALLPGEIVHHKDGNKLNNSFENLEVLPSQSAHARLHKTRGKDHAV